MTPTARPRRTSCGVLILNRCRRSDGDGAGAELLLCRATGTARWDIPKGLAEGAESEREAAARETLEETGVELDCAQLIDLGRFAYLRDKDLHLFAVCREVDIARCVCTSHFRDARGRLRPEMDAFAWVPFDAVAARVGTSLGTVLTEKLSLSDAFDRSRLAGRLFPVSRKP